MDPGFLLTALGAGAALRNPQSRVPETLGQLLLLRERGEREEDRKTARGAMARAIETQYPGVLPPELAELLDPATALTFATHVTKGRQEKTQAEAEREQWGILGTLQSYLEEGPTPTQIRIASRRLAQMPVTTQGIATARQQLIKDYAAKGIDLVKAAEPMLPHVQPTAFPLGERPQDIEIAPGQMLPTQLTPFEPVPLGEPGSEVGFDVASALPPGLTALFQRSRMRGAPSTIEERLAAGGQLEAEPSKEQERIQKERITLGQLAQLSPEQREVVAGLRERAPGAPREPRRATRLIDDIALARHDTFYDELPVALRRPILDEAEALRAKKETTLDVYTSLYFHSLGDKASPAAKKRIFSWHKKLSLDETKAIMNYIERADWFRAMAERMFPSGVPGIGPRPSAPAPSSQPAAPKPAGKGHYRYDPATDTRTPIPTP